MSSRAVARNRKVSDGKRAEMLVLGAEGKRLPISSQRELARLNVKNGSANGDRSNLTLGVVTGLCEREEARRSKTMAEHTELLCRLERENRWLKALVVVMLILLTAGGISAQLAIPSPRVEARQFVLMNDGGRVRADLGNPKDFPVLSFIDPATGDLGMVIGITPSGPVIGVLQPDGTVRNYLDTPVPR
jgi:hypothetical protein